ncbi:MAG: radical SAM protein [bacterium]
MKVAFVIDKIEFSIPLGIAYLSGILKKNGWDAKIFEIGGYLSSALKNLKHFKPDIVAYSVISGKQKFYLDFNKNLKKELNFISLFGGPHATFSPELIEKESVDAVCIGEGELALEEFVKKISDHNEIPEDVLNFWIKKNGKIIKNPVRPLLKELDVLPFPDRVTFYKNFPIINEHGIKHFLAHRGCPYRCTYCFNKAYNDIYKNDKKIYRSRNPQKVCEEINYERTLTKIKMVGFVDDVFTLDKKWIRSFSEIYKKEVGIPFSINARFDNLDEEVICLLKESNCVLVYIGIESGNDFIRNKILKRRMNIDTIIKGANMLKKYKIKFLTENIIGIPGEDFNAALDTLKLNIQIESDFANCSFFSPYPKLELTNYAIENNYFNGDFSKLNINYYHNILLNKKNKEDSNKKLNLRCFFSLIVKHPYLFNFFKRVFFRLPPNRIFRKFGDFVDGYYLKKCLPYKMGLRETLKNIFYYFYRYRREAN